MARQPRTPGATEAPKTIEVAAPTTVQQADDVLNEILGTPDSKDAETTDSTEPTSNASEPDGPPLPTAEDLAKEEADRKEYEEFQAWKNNRAKASEPVTPHVPASGVLSQSVAKQTHSFLGPDGWTTKEIG